MPQTTVNPYGEIGAQITAGLNSIIAALPGSPAISDLVDAVYAYVQPIYYPGSGGVVPPQLTLEIKSIARTAINSYVNNLVMGGQTGYNPNQFRFIEMLIGNSLTANLPIISIGDRIADVEDNISDNQLTVSEQTPLLLATTIGEDANTYWAAQVVALASPWAAYFPPGPEKYMDIPYYVTAAMNGALAGYGATPDSMIEPSVNYVTNKMVSALIGALVCTAGKVIFGWIPRIQHAASMGAIMPFIGGTGGEGKFYLYKWTGLGDGGVGPCKDCTGQSGGYPGYATATGGGDWYYTGPAQLCAANQEVA